LVQVSELHRAQGLLVSQFCQTSNACGPVCTQSK